MSLWSLFPPFHVSRKDGWVSILMELSASSITTGSGRDVVGDAAFGATASICAGVTGVSMRAVCTDKAA